MPVVLAGAALGLEALGVLGVGVFLAVVAFGEEGMHIVGTLFLAVTCLGLGAALGKACLDLVRRGKGWTRSFAVVANVLLMGIAFGTWNGGEGVPWLAVLMLALALTVFFTIMRDSVTAWIEAHTATTLEAGEA